MFKELKKLKPKDPYYNKLVFLISLYKKRYKLIKIIYYIHKIFYK